METGKITMIVDWEEPHTVHDVRVFPGLAKYYRRFVECYSKIVAPLTNLLKKERYWNCMVKRKIAFKELKRTIIFAPVLKLPNFEQSFEVQMDAS
jgi:hypothetical protein